MKKTTTILDFFKVQSGNNISHPACSSLTQSMQNSHTDFCSSSSKKKSVSDSDMHLQSKKLIKNDFGKNAKKKSNNRLSLKKQRGVATVTSSISKIHAATKIEENVHEEEDDVIILDEISISKCVATNSNLVVTKQNELVSASTNEKCKGEIKERQNCLQNLMENQRISDCIRNQDLITSNNSKGSKTSKSVIKEMVVKNSIVIDDNVSAEHSSTDLEAIVKDAQHSLDIDDDVFSQSSDSKEAVNKSSVSYSPYYVANFKYILKEVLSEEENKNLFNDEDMDYISAFESLSDTSQKLYVRLFQRKYRWLRPNKINYPDITKDVIVTLKELEKSGLMESGINKIELETALDMLSLPEAKNLVKQFNFNSNGKSKADITNILMKHCKEHKSVFFTSGRNNTTDAVLKKIMQIIGPCYRISLLPKRLFTRVLMLFSLPTQSDDDEDAAGGQQQQLLMLLQVNKGELSFPDYKRMRKTIIFNCRDELIRYEEAKQLENDIINAVERKEFKLAKDLCISAEEKFDEQCTCCFIERASSLPAFLKRYTSFHVYIRCMTQGVEILQRLKQHNEAVKLLKRLLDQKIFRQDYRGWCWDRMALNLDIHLKQPQKALEAIKESLKDPNVRKGFRHSLVIRALRILRSVDENDEIKKQILEDASVIDAPKVIIKGRLCPNAILGRRNVFISSSSSIGEETDITVLGVEQLAIEHYKNEGFTEGVHGEGSTFISLYALLFWDIIYDGSVPDVFISPYQTHPLDLNSDLFFCSREKQILSHLETIRLSSTEELKEIVKVTWENNFGKASLVTWDLFTDLEHVQGLVCCLGSSILCDICERLARDFRFTRSGVPDLVVWNPETLCVKIVEVKGPGDKLSTKQILWLDYLMKIGAEAEVCLVEAVGSKKLRKE